MKKIDFKQIEDEVLERYAIAVAELAAVTCRLMLEKYHDLMSTNYQ